MIEYARDAAAADRLHEECRSTEAGQSARLGWIEGTAAGRAHRVEGLGDRRVTAADARKLVDEVDAHWQEFYGRELTAQERRAVAIGAQAGGGAVFSGTTQEIARRHGWVVVTDNKATRGGGVAEMVDGRWVGDPEMVARIEAAEAAHEARTGEPVRWS